MSHEKRMASPMASICLCVGIALCVYALSSSNPLSMTKYTQEKSNWCWAACAKMTGKYFGYSHSQNSIVSEIKGSAVNSAASDVEIGHALRYSCNYKYTVAEGGVMTFHAVKQMISNNHFPVVARVKWR